MLSISHGLQVFVLEEKNIGNIFEIFSLRLENSTSFRYLAFRDIRRLNEEVLYHIEKFVYSYRYSDIRGYKKGD